MKKIIYLMLVLSSIRFLNAQEKTLKRDWFYHSMEATFISVQALDAISTIKGISKGAKEINPLAKPFVKNPVLFSIVKGVSTVVILVAFRDIHNIKLKRWLLIGTNVIIGSVVYNNFRIIRD